MVFQDDMSYPFKPNPYFKEWAPLTRRSGCFLQISEGVNRPRLYLLCAEDIWHTARQSLPAAYDVGFDVIEYDVLADVKKSLCPEQSHTVLISEDNALDVSDESHNPSALLTAIDFQRQAKTPYEQACVREANVQAAPAHRAAYEAFMAGASELEISAAYLRACASSENDMPYSIIAGLNEHAAVLHHFMLDNVAPSSHRSFLIDAGVEVNGYASDITRTYAFDPSSEFAAMIALMDSKQQELVAEGGIGRSPADLHILSHLKCAEILNEFGVIKVSAEEGLESRLTETFYPHGLGHHLGCNVHDKGSNYVSSTGDVLPPPAKYPKLRSTAPMVANQIHTVEPGLYFIPAFLQKLRGTPAEKNVDWSQVERFLPFGGIRIEDNVIVHADGRLENLTRDAFSS
jgi:Xaa-Pro dipeptidase